MFGLGTGELIVIFVVAFILFGPQKLPDVARGLGKAIRRFKEETQKMSNELKQTSKGSDDEKQNNGT